jgi:hypothetical protein
MVKKYVERVVELLSGLYGWLDDRKLNLPYVILILFTATAFLAPALRPGYTLLPLQWVSRLLPWSEYIDEPLQNATLGDPFFAFYPRRQFFTEAIRAGEMPFWNPYMLGGYPAVGDTNAQTFYPFNWLAAFFLSPARSFVVLAWFHLTLTGVLMFGMLRSHRLHHASSFLGAISWMLSGILVVWLEHPHRLSSFAWLPGLFWAFNVGNQRRRPAFAVLTGMLFALMILGGQPQYAALGGLLLGVYALSRSIVLDNSKLKWDWWPFSSLAITTIIGLGIGSLQLLPTYEFTLQSHRRPRPMEVWLFSTLPLRHLSTFWLPNLFGSAEIGKYPYWGKMNYVEYTFYFGVFPFLLSMLAPLLNRENKIAWLWGVIVILTVLVAVGSPLTHLAKWIPGMTYFTLHRMMSHVPFLGSWLAALGLDALIGRSRGSGLLYWLLAGVCGLIVATGIVLYACRLEVRSHWDGIIPELLRQGGILVLGFLGIFLMHKWYRIGLGVILLIVVADLFLWGWTFNPISNLDLLYPENNVTDWLKEDDTLYRVLPLRNKQRIFGENVLSAFHIGAPDGYLALTLRHHKELMYAIDPYFDEAPYADEEVWRFRGPHINLIVAQDFSPLHSLLNVKYVLSSVPLGVPQLRHAATFHRVRIYENLDVLPRAYVVHQAETLSRDETFDKLGSPNWNFRKKVLLSEPLTPQQHEALNKAPISTDSQVHITEYAPNRVQLTVTMEHAGLLVLSDPFCQGWQATVDRQDAEIMRANHAMRALFLDAGEHSVTFRFFPRSVVVSVFIAVAACILGLFLLVSDYENSLPLTWSVQESISE